MMDLKLINTLDGGELVQSGNDFATVSGVENTVYLALFGGSKWVGNFLTDKPYQSETEKTLNTVTLNSDGRLQIEQAVNKDLQYLNDIPGTTWTTSVSITGPNSVKIGVTINGQQFDYLWNPTEVVERTTVDTPTAPMPPVTFGLRLSLFSSYGVLSAGSDVSKWNDLSGYGNHMLPTNDVATITDSVFGDEPGIEFTGDAFGKTSFVGLSGEQAATVFLVTKTNSFPVGWYLSYQNTSSGPASSSGEFLMYDDGASLLANGMKSTGNVGICNAFIECNPDTNYIFTASLDYTKVATEEIELSVDNSDAGFTILSSSNNTGALANTNMFIGDNGGMFGCILVYNRNLSDSEKTSVYNYLSDKYSI